MLFFKFSLTSNNIVELIIFYFILIFNKYVFEILPISDPGSFPIGAGD